MTEALTSRPKTAYGVWSRNECSGYCSDYLLRWGEIELHVRDINFNICSCMQREPKSCNSAKNNSGAIGREFESLRAHHFSELLAVTSQISQIVTVAPNCRTTVPQ